MPIKQEFLTCPNFLIYSCTPQDLRIYGLMQLLYRYSRVESVLINQETIHYLINPGTKMSSRDKKAINESLDHLSEMGVVKNDDGKYLLEISKLSDTGGQFVKCGVEAFNKLIDSPGLLFHYLHIIKGMSYNDEIMGRRNVICKLPISHFSVEENVSESSIINYNKELERRKLIYIRRSCYKQDKGTREINIYSLYEDKVYADAFRGDLDYSSKANNRRSITARYNRFKNNSSCYSPTEVMQLKKEVEQYNAECIELGKSQPDYLLKIKDLTIFNT